MFPQEMPQPSPKPNGQPLGKSSLRSAQLFVAALMSGLLLFSVVAVMLNSNAAPPTAGSLPPPDPNRPEADSWIILAGTAGVLMLAGAIGAMVVLPRVAKARAQAAWSARSSDAAGLSAVILEYGQSVILRSAMFEGPGLFGAIVMLLHGKPVVLAVPVLALVGLGFLFPTASRAAGFANTVMKQ